MKTGITKFCLTCGSSFYLSKSSSERDAGKYCCVKCYLVSRKTGALKKCLKCGSPFYVKKNLINKDKVAKYCSMNCYRSHKAVELHLTCLYCKKPFIFRKNIGKIFCSVDCKNKFNNKGITSESKKQRVRFVTSIRKKVFERDNYCCQICKKRGGQLQVDHIKRWSSDKELRFDINNCRTLCMSCHYFITFGKVKPVSITSWGHHLK